MINTLSIKQQQLAKGFFTVGSGDQVMLIMGSCRVCPLVNYFDEWNRTIGNNRFTIHSIDPFSFNWNLNEERVDYEAELKKQETNQQLLEMLSSVHIFLHEHYQNAGMYNTKKDAENNLYKYGLDPIFDICTPSFNDIFILFADILAFDVDLRKKALQDYNVLGKLSEQTQIEIYDKSQDNLDRFYKVCGLSDLPEMADIFALNFKHKRYWHTYNHVSRHFTLLVFDLINSKYLHLETPKAFLESIGSTDMFDNSYTPLTMYDTKWRGFSWGEPTVPLESKIM